MGFFSRNDDERYDDGFIDMEDTATVDEGVDAYDDEESLAPEMTETETAFGGTEIGAAASLELKVVRPEKYEDASGIADHLLAGRTVVLNMDFLNKDIIRRLTDFLAGVAYSIGGQFQRVANNTFIITPRNVEVSEATKEEDADDWSGING